LPRGRDAMGMGFEWGFGSEDMVEEGKMSIERVLYFWRRDSLCAQTPRQSTPQVMRPYRGNSRSIVRGVYYSVSPNICKISSLLNVDKLHAKKFYFVYHAPQQPLSRSSASKSPQATIRLNAVITSVFLIQTRKRAWLSYLHPLDSEAMGEQFSSLSNTDRCPLLPLIFATSLCVIYENIPFRIMRFVILSLTVSVPWRLVRPRWQKRVGFNGMNFTQTPQLPVGVLHQSLTSDSLTTPLTRQWDDATKTLYRARLTTATNAIRE